ncbi:hypothetical protein HYDPIDRAFT_190989, partial [Hydnomerulius pinastri MD-312]
MLSSTEICRVGIKRRANLVVQYNPSLLINSKARMQSGPKVTYSMETLAQCLRPITSLGTVRYNRSCCVQQSPITISRGPAHRSSSPSVWVWRHCIHPEGQPYFAYNGGKLEVVTEANVNDPGTARRVLDWLELVEAQLKEHDITIPPSCELFLELAEDQPCCNYYFVDHTARALFWLEDVATDLLDVPAVVSRSHLEQGLERLYWVHVEFFPMHHKGVFPPEVVDNLYDVISHGQAVASHYRQTDVEDFDVPIYSRFVQLLFETPCKE